MSCILVFVSFFFNFSLPVGLLVFLINERILPFRKFHSLWVLFIVFDTARPFDLIAIRGGWTSIVHWWMNYAQTAIVI